MSFSAIASALRGGSAAHTAITRAVLVGEVKWRQRAQRGAVARKRLINRHNVYVTLIDQTARVPTLDEPTLDRLAAALDRDGVVAAMLVGSQARGSAGPLSDVDVAVWHDRRLDSAKRLKLRLALAMDASRALGTDEVDIILLNGASPLMRHRAIRDGRRLIERDSNQRVQLESRALLDYLDTAPLRAELARGLRHRIEEGRFGRRRER